MKFHISVLLLSFLFILPVNAQWVSMGGPSDYTYSLGVNGNTIFAGGSGPIYKIDLTGGSWITTPIVHHGAMSLASSNGIVYSAHAANGVWISTDNGQTWLQRGFPSSDLHSIAVTGNHLYAGIYYPPQGVFHSSDQGLSWNNTGLDTFFISCLALKGNYVFAGTLAYGLYRSDINGSGWTGTSINNISVISMAVSNDKIFAVGNIEGVFVSTNDGTSWVNEGMNGVNLQCVAADGDIIVAGSISNGVYVSVNNGDNWVQRNEGLGNFRINVMLVVGEYIFAGTDMMVWKRNLSELIGIKTISSTVPSSCLLEQNYPNPFNPSTKIRFEIPQSKNGIDQHVSVVIFDASGRELESIVNSNLRPGSYEAEWNASSYSSGVYFYKLVAGDPSAGSVQNFTQTKKMILIK